MTMASTPPMLTVTYPKKMRLGGKGTGYFYLFFYQLDHIFPWHLAGPTLPHLGTKCDM